MRNLKNDGQYRTGRLDLEENGRTIVKDGDLHAMAKGTNYGEELRHQAWIAFEFQTLEVLFGAGADVPKPDPFSPLIFPLLFLSSLPPFPDFATAMRV